jgi:hypothetical protein
LLNEDSSSRSTKYIGDAAFDRGDIEASLLMQASQKARIIAASEGFAFASTTSREKSR